MPNKIWRSKTTYIGGAATALDSYDGNNLAAGDFIHAVIDGLFHVYKVNGSSSEAENSPFLIVPDVNPGTKRIELIHCSGRLIIEKTADYTLTALELRFNPIYTNNGAGGQVNLNFPTLAEGMRCGGRVEDAQYLKFTAPAGKTFRMASVASAAAGYTRANTVGSAIEFEVFSTDAIDVIGLNSPWKYDV